MSCDRKTNGSAPRQSRSEAEPQRRLTGWSAALSRRTGVSRDQPPEIQAASSGERPSQKTRALLGVGHGWRPLAKAGTAQRGEWPRSAASSGGHGARGGTPGRGLALPGRDGEWAKKRCPNAQLAQRQRFSRAPALPATCRDRTRACHVTGDEMEAVGVSPNLHVRLPLTRYGVKIGGRMGDTRPLTRGEKKDVSASMAREPAPSLRSARRRRFYGIDQPVSLRNCAVLWGTIGGGETRNGRDRFTQGDGLT